MRGLANRVRTAARAIGSRARRTARFLGDRARVDTAVMLALLAVLLAHPGEVIGFFCDLFAIP